MNLLRFLKLKNFDEPDRLLLLGLLKEIENSYTPPISEQIELELYSEKLSQFADIFILEIAGEKAGLLAIYTNNISTKAAFISSIGLRKNFQGKGYGKILLEKARSISIEKGFQDLQLEVNIANGVALDFYYKNGFKLLGRASDSSIFLHLELIDK